MSHFKIILKPNGDGRLAYYPEENLRGILIYVKKLLRKLIEIYF